MQIRTQSLVPGQATLSPGFFAAQIGSAVDDSSPSASAEGIATKTLKNAQLKRPRPYKKRYRKAGRHRDYRADVIQRENAALWAIAGEAAKHVDPIPSDDDKIGDIIKNLEI